MQPSTLGDFSLHTRDGDVVAAGAAGVQTQQFAGLEPLEPRLLLSAVSDDFNADALDTGLWQFIDPVGDSVLVMNGHNALIGVPAGTGHDVWTGGNLAPRIMQAIGDEDFQVEVKFESSPAGAYAMHGIIVEADSANFLRFDFYSGGEGLRCLFAASFLGGAPTVRLNQQVPLGEPTYMRVGRQGDLWTQSYSYDGQEWLAGASFTCDLTPTAVGAFVGNAGACPAYTGSIDYFFNTDSPIAPEDGPRDDTPPQVAGLTVTSEPNAIQIDFATDEAATVELRYGLTGAYELGSVAGGLGTAHSLRIEGLGNEVTYQLQIVATDRKGNTATTELSAATLDITPPQIADLAVTAEPYALVVDLATNEPTTVEVRYGLTDAYELGTVTAVLGADHSLRIEGLDAETAYQLQVVATDQAGNAADAVSLSATTLVAPDLTAPQIGNVVVTAGETSLGIALTTDEPATVLVRYGLTGAYELGFVGGPEGTAHALRIDNLTPGTTYQLQILATDAGGNETAAGLTGSTARGAGARSDDFHADALNAGVWTFVDPQGDATLTMDGQRLLIAVPAGTTHDVWTGGIQAPRIMQAIQNEDFEIEVKFDSSPAGAYAMQGIVVQGGAGSFLRFDFYSAGEGNRFLFAASFAGGSPAVRGNQQVPLGTPNYMRISRQGDLWTQSYSYDGQTWLPGASFTHAMTATAVGVFVGNAGAAPAFTGAIDYFFNTASPIVPEDGPRDTTAPRIADLTAAGETHAIQIDLATDEPAIVQVRYGLTGQFELGTVTGAVGTAHSLRIEGLAGETTYQIQVLATDASGNTATAGLSASTSALPDTTAPTIADVTIAAEANAVQVDFNTDEPATVLVRYGLTDQFELGSVAGALGAAHSLRIEGLDSETTYRLQIVATDASGNVTTLGGLSASTPDVGAPTVTDVAITAEAGAIQVDFTTDESATVEVRFGLTDQFELGSVTGPAGATHSLRIEGLTSETTYQLQIVAVDDSGNTTTVGGLSASTPDVTPATIADVAVTTEPNAIQVDFTTDEPATVELRYGLTDQFELGSVTGPVGTTHSLRIEGLSSETTYQLQIVAVDAGGNTATADLSATTPQASDVTAPAIQDLAVVSGQTSLEIALTTDEPATVTVEYGLTAGYELGSVTGAIGTAHGLRIDGLAAGTTYRLRISAVDASGNVTVSAGLAAATIPQATNDRVTEGLLALYTFDEGSGAVISDASGFGAALNLTIADPTKVTWGDGTLTVHSATLISSAGPASKLTQALAASGEISVEAWISPANLTQQGPARIVSLSDGAYSRDFTLGEGGWGDMPRDVIDVRLRTTATSVNGQPSTTTPAGSLTAALTHVVYTFDATGVARIYLDGALRASANIGGDLSNWDTSYRLLLANELTGDRPWLGTFDLVAFYDQALTADEVRQNYQAGNAIDSTAPQVADLAINTTNSTVEIAFATDEPATCTVQYGLTDAYELGAVTGGPRLEHSFSLTGLQAGTTYHLRIVAVDASGNTSVTDGLTAATDEAPDTVAPQVGNVVILTTDTSIRITFTTDEPAACTIGYGRTGGYEMGSAGSPMGTVHSVTIEGLAAETAYQLRIAATDAAGNTGYSPNLTATTQPAADTTAPAIQNVNIQTGETYVQVDFTTDEPATVMLQYGLTTGYEMSWVAGEMGTVHSLRIVGLTAGTTYQLRLIATDAGGNAAASGNLTAATQAAADTTAPQIRNLAATGHETSITVAFATNEPATVVVQYGLTTGFELGSVSGALGTAHALQIEGLQSQTTYHFRVVATDSSGNVGQTGGFSAATTAPLAFQSDDFNADGLNTGLWTFINPKGDATLVADGTNILISLPAGTDHNIWTAGNLAPRIMQPVDNEDFEIEVKFDSQPTGTNAMQGIIVQANASNFLRFDVYSAGDTARCLFAAAFVNGAPNVKTNALIANNGVSPQYLRVRRTGDVWTFSYSYDGQSWVTGITFTQALAPTTVGTFIGNAGSGPAFTGSIDYFFNTAAPIVPEDGPRDTTPPQIAGLNASAEPYAVNVSFTTDEPASVEVRYGLTEACELGGVTGSAGLAHTLRLDGLDAETTYYYEIFATDAKSNTGRSGVLTVATEPPPDLTAPQIQDVTVDDGETFLEIDFATDEPATVRLQYGLTDSYELGETVGALDTAHSLRIEGLQPATTYQYRILATDPSGNVGDSGGLVAETVDPTATRIDVWYGNVQHFGQNGNVQRWVNILGNATDTDGLVSLSYTLNGGPAGALGIGPDPFRLANAGDFAIEIDRDHLLSGPNTVVIRGTDSLGNVRAKTVTVYYTPDVTWELPTTVDWSTVDNINDAAQVIDGLWELTDAGVHTVQTGYDRLVGIGDVTWTDYEITVPVTIHANNYSVGVLMRWQGHYTWGNTQPAYGWWPLGAIGWFRADNQLQIYGEGPMAQKYDVPVELNVPYIYKMRVETEADGLSRYSLKVWQQGTPEPGGWDLTALGQTGSLSSGSVLLMAHYSDATFGNVTVVPVN